MAITKINKEREKAAQDWLRSHPDPNQDLCPELIQYWKNSQGYMNWSSKTGVRTQFGPNSNANKHETGKRKYAVRPFYLGVYIAYVPELDALEISELYMDGNRGVDGKPKKWRYLGNSTFDMHRYLIFHNDSAIYEMAGACINGKYYNKDFLRDLRQMENLTSQAAYTEFKKFYPKGLDIPHYYDPDWPPVWSYERWYEREFMPRSTSKTTEDLLEYEFTDVTIPKDELLKHLRDSDYHGGSMALFQKLDDQYCIIRVVYCENGHYNWRNQVYEVPDDPRMVEKLRIFISSKGKPTTMMRGWWGSNWSIQSNVGYRGSDTIVLINRDEAKQWNALKYTLPVLGERFKVYDLLALLRHPIVEQIAKAGYPAIAKMIAEDGKVPSNLKAYFGVEKETKTPIYKLLGVNKYLLKKFEESMADNRDRRGITRASTEMIQDIKRIYDRFDVSDLDEKTINLLTIGLSGEGYSRLREWIPNGNYNYWNRTPVDITEDDRKNLLKLFRMKANGETSVMRTWADICNTWKRINNRPEINLYRYRSIDDLVRMHDALVGVLNTEELERQAQYNERKRQELEQYKKEFDKRQKDRIERFEYENDKFCVRVPKELSEIQTEGIMLHHCVGGYCHSHATGNTNILFLRRKGAEDVSFYTIEIRGDRVIQIHGLYNRWLGNNPEAVPFMYEYLKQLGVHFDKSMLLNKGSGYSAGTEVLPESALYSA